MNLKRKINRSLADISKRLGFSMAWGYPSALMIEPTNNCNLACVLCPTGATWLKHPQGYMNFKKYCRLIDEASPYLYRIAFWNWGEPFLHKALLDMIDYTKRYPIFTQVSTNGHFFTDPIFSKDVIKSGIDHIIISVDGYTTESIQQYRGPGADLDQVLHGLSNLISSRKSLRKKHPQIEAQFLVMSHNHGEIEKVRASLMNMGVDRFCVKSMNIRPQDIQSFLYLLPNDERLTRFEFSSDGRLSPKGKPTGICPYIYEATVVLWDGSLVPCCFDAEESVILGNAFNDGLWHAWNNINYRRFRYLVRHNRAEMPMCSWCPEERTDAQGKKIGRYWADLDIEQEKRNDKMG